MPQTRSASASIKGYLFQFDTTIKNILESKHGQRIVIEGIEDIDINSQVSSAAIQCKYYERTALTCALLRSIVKPMLIDFKKRKTKIRYYVYGFFPKKLEANLFNDVSKFKKNILAYTKRKDPKKYNLAADLRITNNDLKKFLGKFNIRYVEKYDSHQNTVKRLIEDKLKCSQTEVENIFYNNALSTIAQIASRATKPERTITRANFINKINTKNVLYNQWTLQEKGEITFCRKIRRQYFTHTNISPCARIFIVECDNSETFADLKNLILKLRANWSSHSKKRKSNNERYAPYVLFRGLDVSIITSLKKELLDEDIKFVDGYPFEGSDFTPKHLCQKQTQDNMVSIRFISSIENLNHVISYLKDETKEIFEFYKSQSLDRIPHIKHIQIPVTDINLINEMI